MIQKIYNIRMKKWAAILMLCFSLSCLAQTNLTNVVSSPSSMVSNIIALKQANVSDAVIITYLRTQLRQIPVPVNPPPAPKVRVIDPDSYEYFYRYYLYPRTLRYQYQLFRPYYPPNREVKIHVR